MNVGLDVGYSHTKAMSGSRRTSFPSAVGTPDKVRFSLGVRAGTIILTSSDHVQAVATLPPEQWAGWVCYLLEALDGKADEAAFRDCLESVRDGITTRLEVGRW